MVSVYRLVFFLCPSDKERTTLRLASFTLSAIEGLAQGKKERVRANSLSADPHRGARLPWSCYTRKQNKTLPIPRRFSNRRYDVNDVYALTEEA
jgi:hypothetical protein